MAKRIQLGDLRIQQLLSEGLLPLYLLTGSVNALAEKLNEAFETKEIYPNRLHALLSAAPSKSINDATLEQIEGAVAKALAGGALDEARLDEEIAKWRRKLLPLWASHGSAVEAIPTIAEELGVPWSAVYFVLENCGIITAATNVLAPVADSAAAKSSEPDFSFQDEAVSCCLRSLRQSPNKKVGLVVPTGGTKTRIAIRTGMALLAAAKDTNGNVVWVTHRKSLRRQAHRELQKMLLEGGSGLPDDAAKLLSERFDFVMVGKLPQVLESGNVPALVIVDEAHHAAAASYKPIFETAYPLRGLFLTATPNRTDDLPIGIDEIAYSTTYRELARRNVILIPTFEDFPVEDFNWKEKEIEDLADALIRRTADDLAKTLVLAPRIHRVEEFYDVLVRRLKQEPNHPLSEDDIGFIHGTKNSLGCNEEEFLALYRDKPRAILVSAQLLFEGFDDPAIDSVVMTYPSSSMIQLMQAVGRCVRYSPGKKKATVIQAYNRDLAYRFDHRWLYQEISDALRPALQDVTYGSKEELVRVVVAALERHNAPEEHRTQILAELENVAVGTTCRLMLSGITYFGAAERFAEDSQWMPILETDQNSDEFRAVFNYCCQSAENVANPTNLLEYLGKRYGFSVSYSAGSKWRQYVDLATSMHCAWNELFGNGARNAVGANRAFEPNGSTSWLTYVTFHHHPVVAPELTNFLSDCYNAEAISAAVAQQPNAYKLVVKLPLPLGTFAAFLLSPPQAAAFAGAVNQLRTALKGVAEADQFAAYATAQVKLELATGLPQPLLARLEQFLPAAADQRRFWLTDLDA